MGAIKVSSKVDAEVWRELKTLAEETHQSLAGLVTDAIREYLERRRVRPLVLKHLEDSIDVNQELGRLLAE